LTADPVLLVLDFVLLDVAQDSVGVSLGSTLCD
jgi:hypothetical protein